MTINNSLYEKCRSKSQAFPSLYLATCRYKHSSHKRGAVVSSLFNVAENPGKYDHDNLKQILTVTGLNLPEYLISEIENVKSQLGVC